jgi:uncharacterized protein YodC (DUF2158 family)
VKIGDVVRLLSGGPKMTVVRVPGIYDDYQEITCSWFADNNTVMRRSFPRASLEWVEDEEG